MTEIPAPPGRLDTVEQLRGRCETLEALLRAQPGSTAEFLRQILDIIPHFVFAKDRRGRFTLVNRAVAEAYGTTVEQLIGKTDADFNANGDEVAHFRRDDLEVMDLLREKVIAKEAITDASGRTRWLQTIKRPIIGRDGRADQMLGVSTDITRHVQFEEQLSHAALHDPLTDLPNRALFRDRLALAIERARRGEGSGFAVMFVDLDRFKLVNDGLGHAAGDRLLVEVAQRLRRCLPPGDTLARLGGDEFTMLLDAPAGAAESTALAVAQRLREQLAIPIRLDGRDLYVSATIGISMGDHDGANVDEILRDADTALYRAKATSRGSHVVFTPAMHALVVAHLELQSELWRAIETGELSLAFQPIYSLADGRLCEAEALLRWTHPTRGQLRPDDFLAVALEAGCMLRIEEWLLGEASRALAALGRLPGEPVGLSINLASALVAIGDSVERVLAALAEAGVSPDRLRIEVTETTVMQHVEIVSEKLAALRARGVRVDIDDFGTGYSSLSRLHRLPLDRLKIDRSFVHRLEGGPDGLAIVRTIVALAHALGLETAAEGVETPGQLELVRALGCTHAQGYLLSAPVSLDDLLALPPRHARLLQGAAASPRRRRGHEPERFR